MSVNGVKIEQQMGVYLPRVMMDELLNAIKVHRELMADEDVGLSRFDEYMSRLRMCEQKIAILVSSGVR